MVLEQVQHRVGECLSIVAWRPQAPPRIRDAERWQVIEDHGDAGGHGLAGGHAIVVVDRGVKEHTARLVDSVFLRTVEKPEEIDRVGEVPRRHRVPQLSFEADVARPDEGEPRVRLPRADPRPDVHEIEHAFLGADPADEAAVVAGRLWRGRGDLVEVDTAVDGPDARGRHGPTREMDSIGLVRDEEEIGPAPDHRECEPLIRGRDHQKWIRDTDAALVRTPPPLERARHEEEAARHPGDVWEATLEPGGRQNVGQEVRGRVHDRV